MRILHVISSLGAGGAETLARDLAIEQASRGHACAIAYLSELADIGRSPDYATSFTAELDRRGIAHALIGHRRNPPRAAFRLNRLIRHFRPDLVHAHLASGAIVAGLAATGTPIIYTHHASFFPFSRRWMPVLNRLVRAYVGVCEASACVLRPFATRPVRVIHNGRRPPQAAMAPRALPEGELRVLSVGSLVREKDYATLARTARLARSGRHSLRFAVAGDGPERSAVEAALQAEGVADAVSLLGARQDVEALMRDHDVLLSTSRTEALPMAMIEALQMALPIVATKVGGAPDLVREEATGLLAPPGDAEALARQLLRLADDPALYARLSEGAYAHAAEFSMVACQARYEALYSDFS